MKYDSYVLCTSHHSYASVYDYVSTSIYVSSFIRLNAYDMLIILV